jgi:hypothetical protein
MHSLNGTIVGQSKAERGYWYTFSSIDGIHRFFSKKEAFSLFENCEVVLEKKNNCFFLADYTSLDDVPPLRSRPDNIIAAFWLSRLAGSLTFSDSDEFDFIDKCRQAIFSDFHSESLDEIENCYLEVSGFNLGEEREKVIHDCFYNSINLRRSLINQLSSRRRK